MTTIIHICMDRTFDVRLDTPAVGLMIEKSATVSSATTTVLTYGL